MYAIKKKLIVNCFMSLSEIIKATVEIAKGISHQRRSKGARRRKKKKEEEKVTEERGRRRSESGRQAGEQAFSVRRKISQPGRGPMPVNSVGRSLTR